MHRAANGSFEEQPTSVQNAANGRDEPKVQDAAICTNVSNLFEAAVQEYLATQKKLLAAVCNRRVL